LARLYETQGRYLESEPLQKRALASTGAVVGPKHPDVAIRLSNLALLYSRQGRYAEAKPLYERALAIRQKTLPADHPLVAQIHHNLASLHHDQGRYEQAEAGYRRALKTWHERAEGGNPEVATMLNSLATLYLDQDRFGDAEAALRPALAELEASLGSRHPYVAVTLHNLALACLGQGRIEEAKQLIDLAIEIFDRFGGTADERSQVYTVRARLAWAEGSKQSALADLRRALELAILSACDTNTGPEQRGEGVWALSRGFVVAGARRVVASNWLVDDEAAASLVSYFCGGIAQAEARGENSDCAKCLHEAKRFIRKQEKWKSPYYWAPFVLVGPN
jgi:tetratricopeptide (TPR) repeat protein